MKSSNFLVIAIVVILAAASGYIYLQKIKPGAENQNITAPKPEKGGDKDVHGCIGSAGYTWCEIKNKCIKNWEEPCSNEPVKINNETIEKSIKEQLVNKHGSTAQDLNVKVSTIEGIYAKGTASATGGGGLWFAVKVKDNWELIWDGNGVILCSDLSNYTDFPNTLIPQCYDKLTDSLVKR